MGISNDSLQSRFLLQKLHSIRKDSRYFNTLTKLLHKIHSAVQLFLFLIISPFADLTARRYVMSPKFAVTHVPLARNLARQLANAGSFLHSLGINHVNTAVRIFGGVS